MFEPTGFSLQIFKDRYAFTPEESFGEACKRVADQMARGDGRLHTLCFFTVIFKLKLSTTSGMGLLDISQKLVAKYAT